MEIELCLTTGIDENGEKITKEEQEIKLVSFINKNPSLDSREIL